MAHLFGSYLFPSFPILGALSLPLSSRAKVRAKYLGGNLPKSIIIFCSVFNSHFWTEIILMAHIVHIPTRNRHEDDKFYTSFSQTVTNWHCTFTFNHAAVARVSKFGIESVETIHLPRQFILHLRASMTTEPMAASCAPVPVRSHTMSSFPARPTLVYGCGLAFETKNFESALRSNI